jgi:Fe-S cluster assembly protein SufD
MSAYQTLPEVLKQGEFSPSGETLVWLDAIHAQALEQGRKLGVPSRREESWRCTDLDFLLKTPFHAVSEPSFEALSAEFRQTLTAYGGSLQAVLIDGFFSQKESRLAPLPEGTVLMGLADAIKAQPEKIRPYLEGPVPNNFFSALNAGRYRDGIFLYVPAGICLPKPIDFVLVSTRLDQPAVCYPKLVIVAEKETAIRIRLIQAACPGSNGLVNASVDLVAGEDSEVRWIHLQKETGAAWYLTSVNAQLAARSRLEMLSFWGGQVRGRTDVQVHLCGDEADYSLDGVAVLGGVSQISQAILASHEASWGTGRQCYKNILTGKALAEFNSLVSVAAHTKGNDSGQLNRNLILSEDARAYSRPQLKIDADEVKATHGSATGRLRDSELFYLKSRGLSPEDARRMLIRGFVQEILTKIADDDLRRDLQNWVNEYLKVTDVG